MTNKEAMQIALDALEELNMARSGLESLNHEIEALRTALAQPEPAPIRLRRGDILRCIETNELCTVWATSTTGKTQVKWKSNDFGSYTAEQIGNLFWVEPKTEPEPVAWMYDWTTSDGEFIQDWTTSEAETLRDTDPNIISNIRPLYTAVPQREWVGLTGEELQEIYDGAGTVHFKFAMVEAKLKQKNT